MASTRWHRRDNEYHSNMKVAPLVVDLPRAVMLHGELCAYCARHLTDGFVPAPIWPQLGQIVGMPRAYRVREAVHELAAAGLVDMVPGGLMVHDFLVMNPQLNRATVEAERDRWRQSKRAARAESPGGTIVDNANDVPAPTRHDSRYIPLVDDVTGVDVHRPEDNGHG